MSKLAQIVEGKKFVLNGVELEFKSVEFDEDVAMLMEKGDIPLTKQIEITRKLIKKMLKEAVPDASDKELNDCMRLKTLMPLMDIFYEINGMLDEKNLSNAEKIKNAIKARQAQRAKS